jgi:hypothetical protein
MIKVWNCATNQQIESFSLNLTTMSPPRVGAPSRTGRSTQSTTRGPQGRTSEMPTVVDVDEIHTPEYEQTTLHVEEEQESTQEPEQLGEDVVRTEPDASRGKGPQGAKPTMESTQQGLGAGTRAGNRARGGVPSPQGKKRCEQKPVRRAYNAPRQS